MTPAEAFGHAMAQSFSRLARASYEEQAIAHAAHLAAMPGVISAVYNPATASIDLVVEPEPLTTIELAIAVDACSRRYQCAKLDPTGRHCEAWGNGERCCGCGEVEP
jgi:hypothetical protein